MVKLIVCSLCFTLTDKERQRPTPGVRYSDVYVTSELTVILNNYFEKFLSAHSLLRKIHNLSLTSVICRKRDCKSLKFLAISKGEIKMAVYK